MPLPASDCGYGWAQEVNAIAWEEGLSPPWDEIKESFLEAVAAKQRSKVAALLREPGGRGRGLRTWLRALAAQEQAPPERLPVELVQVYLDDEEALPLHDCAGCGVAIPVRPDWQRFEGEPQHTYFPDCPCCGERTGLYAAWSRRLAVVPEAACRVGSP